MWLLSTHNSSLTQLWQQLGITALILAMMAALAFVVVRVLKPRLNPTAKNTRMSVVETLQLAPRRSIHLIKVDERELIVGSCDTGMELLGELPSRDSRELEADNG